MNFSTAFPNLSDIFRIMLTIFVYGGWVLFVFLIIQILYTMYKHEIQHQFVHSQEWVFLNIKVPRENLTSTMAVDTIFQQMHALHSSLTFAEQYTEGRTQLWYSLEIISLGGKISFIIRTPKAYKDLTEAAIYAHYPEAEITQISDYMENLHYDPDTSEFEVWGVEYSVVEDDVIPIRTYRDFEHPAAEEKIIDPLANLFEAMAKMGPNEFFGVQVLIQPLADDEWKPKAERKVKELIDEEVAHESKFSDLLTGPLNAAANFSFKETLLSSHHGHEEKDNKKNNWQNMTDLAKERVNAIERKLSKPAYRTKIRQLYIAPKDKFVKKKPYVVIGAYRIFGSTMTNKLKPSGKIWTSVAYAISPSLEGPYIEYEQKRRRRNVFKAYKERDIHIGIPQFIMNTEEIATLYHFPISTKPISSTIEKTESKKSQAPANLPVADVF